MPDDDRYSLSQFIQRTTQRDRGQGLFELETDRLLEVNLSGMVWIKTGVMVAYNGNVRYTREGMLEHGIGNFFKKALTFEGTALTKAEGQGKVYLADEGKKVTILALNNETLFVNGNNVLAFEPAIKYEITMMRRIAGVLAGGLFNIRLSGAGLVAITAHYEPITLRVTPGSPVFTDPNATVAWSGSLTPELKTDISFKTLLGRGSGESLQLAFNGDGFVIIQPYEEVALASGNPG
jgi:uncharacterized protein (AIM24 family)